MYWRQLFCLSTRDQTSKITIQHNSSHQRNFIQSRITQRTDTHQQTSQVVIIQSGSYFQMFLNFIFFPARLMFWREELICKEFHRLFSLCPVSEPCISRYFCFPAKPYSIHPGRPTKHTEPLFAPFQILLFLNIVDTLASNLLLQICLLLSH